VAEEADPVEGVVYRAESFLTVGQVERAETLVRDELGRHPDDASLLLMLAKIYEARRMWPEVIATARATLEANPNSLTSHMMLAWAGYQVGDRDLMKRSLDEVLENLPDQPTALMYLALHNAPDRSKAGTERTRALMARSLEHGGGNPWYPMMAAQLEVFLGRSAEARRLVDMGLAQSPMDAQLLKLKADLATDNDESMGIVTGLLASSPADASLRSRFDALVAARRRALLSMLWLAPALIALGVGLVSGGLRVSWLIGVAAASFTVWGARLRAAKALPAPYRAELDSKAPWRVATRLGGRASALLTVVGGLLLATGVAPGAWLLVVATLGWVVTRLASLAKERRVAAEIDAQAKAMNGTERVDARAGGPAVRAVARGRWSRAVTTPLLVIPGCVFGLVPAGPPDEGSTARAALGLIAAIVGLMSLVEATPWVRQPGKASTTAWRIVRLAVPAVLLTVVALVSIANLVLASSGWASGRPAAPSDGPTTPATIPPGYFDDLESPSPLPTLDLPDFDVPTIPTIDVPPTAPEG
jgi:tetratricopeptide (TPR) repeat protein